MIELKGICKTFDAGTVNEKTIFSDLNLKVEDGEFVTIIGSNGAGKSSLFNVIGGDFFADKGDIFLGEKNITWLPVHERAREIGRLYQDPMRGTAPNMTIEENLALAAGSGKWLSRISSKEKDRFKTILSELNMGLEDRLTDPVGLLSGGQRQALTLMMAVINPPKLLMLDEHTAALDPATAQKVLAITKKVAERDNLTVLMITHDMHMALELGTRTMMMDSGNIIYDVRGEERDKLKVEDLLHKFKEAAGKELGTDRVLLEK